MLEPDYPLRTDRLDLRPFTSDDYGWLHEMHSDPDIVRYLYWEPHDELATSQMLARKRRRTSLVDPGDTLTLAVEVRATGEVAGEVVFFWHSRESRQGEIGYIFRRSSGGHGYATEAAERMLRLGFDELGLHRIAGRLDARNAASARVLERLGMRKEAHLVQNELVKGEWADELVYAMLEDEWRHRASHAPTQPPSE